MLFAISNDGLINFLFFNTQPGCDVKEKLEVYFTYVVYFDYRIMTLQNLSYVENLMDMVLLKK